MCWLTSRRWAPRARPPFHIDIWVLDGDVGTVRILSNGSALEQPPYKLADRSGFRWGRPLVADSEPALYFDKTHPAPPPPTGPAGRAD